MFDQVREERSLPPQNVPPLSDFGLDRARDQDANPRYARRAWVVRNNSKASNKPLEAILRVNATRRPFEWLVHGDDDTCFALERLAAFLRKLDARAPWFLSSTCHGPAHRVPPGGPRCCISRRARRRRLPRAVAVAARAGARAEDSTC